MNEVKPNGNSVWLSGYVIEIYWTISARLCPQSGLFVFNSDEKGAQESQARRLERKIWSC